MKGDFSQCSMLRKSLGASLLIRPPCMKLHRAEPSYKGYFSSPDPDRKATSSPSLSVIILFLLLHISTEATHDFGHTKWAHPRDGEREAATPGQASSKTSWLKTASQDAAVASSSLLLSCQPLQPRPRGDRCRSSSSRCNHWSHWAGS